VLNVVRNNKPTGRVRFAVAGDLDGAVVNPVVDPVGRDPQVVTPDGFLPGFGPRFLAGKPQRKPNGVTTAAAAAEAADARLSLDLRDGNAFVSLVAFSCRRACWASAGRLLGLRGRGFTAILFGAPKEIAPVPGQG